ncbi:MAG: vWA domain-containing protein [Gemmatimonadaceae bacterium]
MTLSLRTDRRLIRSQASSARYLLVSFTAPEPPPRAERLPVNVALILDRSGSMAGARKFALARDAVEQALRMLRSEDRFTLVVYDERVDVLTQSTFATPDAKRRALDALRDVAPRGSTDLCAGWMRGCEQIAESLTDDAVSRALLLTDGLANHGTIDREVLARHAGELRQRGIATSTFGVGEDFDELLLRDMAHEGGGNFYFIESPQQIPDLLTSELGEALEVVLRQAALRIALPRGADAEPLNRFRSVRTRGDNELRVELGDLVSGQEVRATIRVQFPHGNIGDRTAVSAVLAGDDGFTVHGESSIEWVYASHTDNDLQPRDREVDHEVAQLYVARARAEATEANRRGDFRHARQALERTADHIDGYAGDDQQLQEIAMMVREQVPKYADYCMSPVMLKAAFYDAEVSSKGRSRDGRARRRPTP